MKQSIVIIGGGMGGLFTGAFLAKEGYEITILEKNPIIGGGLQCFKRRGELFETGMHILGGFQKGGSLNKICNYLGVLSKLSIRPTDDDAIDQITYESDGMTYYIPRTRERFLQYFAGLFPAERDGLERYLQAMYDLSEEVNLFNLREGDDFIMSHSEEFSMPVDAFIAKYISTPRLRDVLAYMNPMYGGVAGHTPAYVHALINVLYIEGSSQFEGGSQQLADALADLICRHGGRIFKGDAVTRIEVVERNIQKVVTAKGREYTADWYISDIHPCSLIELTGPEAFPKAYRNRLNEIGNSYSCFSVYIKFKHACEPYVNHPRYYLRGDDSAWHLTDFDNESWPTGFMCITPPSVGEYKWATRMIVNCLMSFDRVRQWADTKVGHRGEEYERWKEAMMNKVIDKLEYLSPGVKSHIEFCFASSPLTVRDYFGTKEGSLYGFQRDSQNLLQSQVPIVTKVKNLLLTGQNVNLHGICGVPLTSIDVTEFFIGQNNLIRKINEANN